MPPAPSSGRPPTLGILGGGQLGRMTALAALRMGVDVRLLTPESGGSETAFAGATVADWTDADVLRRWAAGCDAVTVESEWAPADRIADAMPGLPLWPAPATLLAVRHKGRQRAVLDTAGLPAPPFEAVATVSDAHAARARMGGTVVLKRFEGSYDGYGNATCHSDDEVDAAWEHLAAPDGLLVEAFASFESEAAVIVARRAGGDHVVYPVVRTEQRDHRLHAAELPARLSADVEALARRVALGAVEALDAVGVLAVEFFVMADGQVWINEVAPRPHNTGHITIEACHTSQFENHVRAVLDWPLGDPSLRAPAAALVNVLGHAGAQAFPDPRAALAVPGAAVHLYGKAESRARRKMGHVTVTADSPDRARLLAEQAAASLTA